MKNITTNFLLILLGIGLFSCGDDDNSLKINAEVLEYETLKPIANAKVYIFGGEPNGGLGGSTFFLVDSVMTDEQGGFIWDSEGAPSASFYSIKSVQAEGYYNINEEVLVLGNSIEGGTQQIILDPYAWLHLKVIDDPVIITDFCRTNATFISGSGLFGEFEELYQIRGNRDIYVYIKTSMEPSEIDTLYISALDTLYHEIRF